MGRGCGDQTILLAKPQTTVTNCAAVSQSRLAVLPSGVASSKVDVKMKIQASSISVAKNATVMRKSVVKLLLGAASFVLVYNSAKGYFLLRENLW